MRHFACALLAFIVVLSTLAATSFSLAQKSICVPIRTKNNTIDPNQIPVSQLNMTNRGRGPVYRIAVSLCSPLAMTNDAYPGCVGAPGYIVAHQAGTKNKTCNAIYNKPVGRPTVSRNGFTTIYGSTLNGADNNLVSLTVVCSRKAPARLVSRSNKFAILKNKLGGYTTYMVVYSAVACGSRPPSPPPGPSPNQTTCRSFPRGRTMINPASWRPAVLDLMAGFSQPKKFAFSLCDGTPSNLPSWLPDCPTASYITRYFISNNTCAKMAFDRMVRFRPGLSSLSLTYTSTAMKKYMNISAYAQVNVFCGKMQKGLYSPYGTYSRFMKGNSTLVLVYNLAHPDMCVTLPTTRPSWTRPTRPSNWTRPTWTFPTRPTRTFFPHPTNWTRPSWTRPSWTRPSNWTRPTWFTRPSGWTKPSNWTRPTWMPHPTNWTRPSWMPHPTNWTRPSWTRPSGWTRPSNWTRPTWFTRPSGHHTFPPHPTNWTRPSWTRPTGHPTFPPRPTNWTRPTRPTGHHTFPPRPTRPTSSSEKQE